VPPRSSRIEPVIFLIVPIVTVKTQTQSARNNSLIELHEVRFRWPNLREKYGGFFTKLRLPADFHGNALRSNRLGF
jgi:hypothetical protein